MKPITMWAEIEAQQTKLVRLREVVGVTADDVLVDRDMTLYSRFAGGVIREREVKMAKGPRDPKFWYSARETAEDAAKEAK